MAGLYDRVREEKERPARRRSGVLVGAVAASVLILAIIGGLIVRSISNELEWRSFVGDLSAATYYAYQNYSLRADGADGAARVLGENIYWIYNYLTIRGPWEKTEPEAPEAEAVKLTYGNGTTLHFWNAPEKNGKKTLFLLLETAEGRQYAYLTQYCYFSNLSVRVSPLRNEPWEGHGEN